MISEDFEWFSAIWTLPEINADLPSAPCSHAEAWSAFLRNAGQWQTVGYGQWAVVDRSSRDIVGQVGFISNSDREAGAGRRADACWIVEPRARGRGLGLEAAQAAHDWFDRVIRISTCVRIAPGNAAGAQVAHRLGYRPAVPQVPASEGGRLLVRRERV